MLILGMDKRGSSLPRKRLTFRIDHSSIIQPQQELPRLVFYVDKLVDQQLGRCVNITRSNTAKDLRHFDFVFCVLFESFAALSETRFHLLFMLVEKRVMLGCCRRLQIRGMIPADIEPIRRTHDPPHSWHSGFIALCRIWGKRVRPISSHHEHFNLAVRAAFASKEYVAFLTSRYL